MGYTDFGRRLHDRNYVKKCRSQLKSNGLQCGGAVAYVAKQRTIDQWCATPLEHSIILNFASPSDTNLQTIDPPSTLIFYGTQCRYLLAICVVQHKARGLVRLIQPHLMILGVRPVVSGTFLSFSSQYEYGAFSNVDGQCAESMLLLTPAKYSVSKVAVQPQTTHEMQE